MVVDIKSRRSKRRKMAMPTAFTILFFIIAIIIIISWIPGTTQITVSADGTKTGGPAGIFDLFLAPLYGFKNRVDIIIFVLVIGGFIAIVIKSRALDAGISRMILKMKGRELWLIPILMTLFSLGGTTYGMGEETIALYPVLIPVLIAAGFDAMTSVMVILIGAGMGCMASTVNPFVIAVSSSAYKEFAVSDGMAWRWIVWVIVTIAGAGFATWYAAYTKKNPTKSPLYQSRDFYLKEFSLPDDIPAYTTKHKFIMAIFFSAFILMIASMISYSSFGDKWPVDNSAWVHEHAPYLEHFFAVFGDWYMEEIAALFFLASIIIAAIDWKGEKVYLDTFIAGSSDILSVCLIIATASGIGWVMSSTNMQTVVVNGLSSGLQNLGPVGFAVVSYFPFLVISFFIPSTSGFASAVMPIVGPVADHMTTGMSAGAVLSFSMANGLINLFSPTGGIMMAALAISKVPLNKWYRGSWPFAVIFFILSLVLLVIGAEIPGAGGIFYGNGVA